MLQKALLKKIDTQIETLKAEIKELKSAETKKTPYSLASLFRSVKCLSRSKLSVKESKLEALYKLTRFVRNNDSDGFHCYVNKNKDNAYNPIFSGFNNRTQKLFKRAAEYLLSYKKDNAESAKFQKAG